MPLNKWEPWVLLLYCQRWRRHPTGSTYSVVQRIEASVCWTSCPASTARSCEPTGPPLPQWLCILPGTPTPPLCLHRLSSLPSLQILPLVACPVHSEADCILPVSCTAPSEDNCTLWTLCNTHRHCSHLTTFNAMCTAYSPGHFCSLDMYRII
jgi:hypothetical protein